MITLRRLLISLACATLVVGLFSWPLFAHFSKGIPHTSISAERPPVRHMVMGDHLQLLYHFWLAADWLKGETPAGFNPYTFNEGDDADTAAPMTDYMPFAGVFALLHLLLSRAASWNLTIIFAVWMSHFFLWRLLRFYGLPELAAAALALMAVSFPYQWATAFGGSPTGFAMMAVPMILFGVEAVVRRGSIGGGCIAALGILTAFWSDAHVILFSLLLGPVWGVLVLLHDDRFPWRTPVEWLRRVAAAAPIVIMAAAAALIRMGAKEDLGETIVGAGRTWHEVTIFSPRRHGLYTWHTVGHDHTIYLGWLLIGLLMLAVLWGVFTAVRDNRWRRLAHVLLLAGAFAAIVAFALGPHGPRDALVFRMARELISPIGMIRQPAKVFALLAPILAVMAVPLWRLMADRPASPWLRQGLPVIVAALVLADWRMQVRPGISLLNEEQGAYAAVARDAEEPRVLVVPLWPGDSAWSSLYQHNASLYRLRMINGYLPVVSRDYIERVYRTLDGVNTGVLTDDQIRFVKERGIDYLILHQNAFPEQVSWFPVGFTLKKMLAHPRLRLMEQDGPVWAFRILDEPDPEAPARPVLDVTETWRVFGSRIQSEMDHERRSGDAVIRDDRHASSGHYVRLSAPGDAVEMGAFTHQEADEPGLMVRLRGRAEWRFVVENDEHESVTPIATDEPQWRWVRFPMPWEDTTTTLRPGFHLESGELDLDRVSYVSGVPPRPEPGDTFVIPAPVLFHAGYTDLKRNAVVFRPMHEQDHRILYGPRWAVPEGVYRAEIVWAESPPPDIAAGRLEIRMGLDVVGTVQLTGHDDAPLEFSTRERNLPLEFGFHYAREADLYIQAIRVTRVE